MQVWNAFRRDSMKNIWKKNQVIIMALVIMIAVAGYLNFTEDKLGKNEEENQNYVETAVLDTEKQEWILGEGDSENKTDMKGTVTPGTTEKTAAFATPDATEKTAAAATPDTTAATSGMTEKTADNQEVADISAEDMGEDVGAVGNEDFTAAAENDNTGEAVLVNQTIGADFFQTQKMSREQTRAKNKETLLEIINNKNCTEEQREKAAKQVQEMIDAAERESAAELLLEAKGFSNSIVTMVDGSVDVVVEADNLTMQEMAQIEDIVKRKTGVDVKNIVISPVAVTEK